MDLYTMKTSYRQRLNYVDQEHAIRRVEYSTREALKTLAMIRREPEILPQTRYSSIASSYLQVAEFSYALGYPVATVREAFAHAARTLLKVFELRGTEDVFPAYILKYDPNKNPSDPTATELSPIHPPGTKDFSLANSSKGLRSVHYALIGGQDALAAELAALIWDPPNADYIGPRSEVCTPNDQRLAYAVRELFAGSEEGVLSELKGVRVGRIKAKDIAILNYAMMIRSLVTQDAAAFHDALGDYLAWHLRWARDEQNIDKADFFLCIPGLGLSKLALQRGLITIDDLPQNDVYLPLDLIH